MSRNYASFVIISVSHSIIAKGSFWGEKFIK